MADVDPADLGAQGSPEPADQKGTASSSVRAYARGFLRDPITFLALVFLVLLLIGTLFADFVAPYGANEQVLTNRFAPPLSTNPDGGFIHLLGTDALGRDVLSRLLFGGRISTTVGLLSVLLSGMFGVFVGIMAGYYRGRLDDVLSRLVDVMIGFPSLLAAMFILFIIGPGFWNVVLVLAIIRWHVYARVTRGLAMSYREAPFIEGAMAIGLKPRRIIWKHIFPNLLSPVLVLATLEVATAILLEAGLSFLGFGVRPPTPSWGIEVASSRQYLRTAWWLITFPGLIIFMTTLSLNLTATWLRTITDPVQRWRWFASGRRARKQAAASESA